MPAYQSLSRQSQKNLLGEESKRLGIDAAILEKDLWMVWFLDFLFNVVGHKALTFIGGTCLSKIWLLTPRMSEDIDLRFSVLAATESVRAPDQIYPVDETDAQQWMNLTKQAMVEFIDEIETKFAEYTEANDIYANIYGYKPNDSSTCSFAVNFNPVKQIPTGLYPHIKVDINGSGLATPNTEGEAYCYMNDNELGIETPTAFNICAAEVEAIFWSKVGATIQYCHGFERCSPRPRDWFDIYHILDSDYRDVVLESFELALQGAKMRDFFYPDKHQSVFEILTTNPHIVPSESHSTASKNAYDDFLGSGMVLGDPTPYEDVMQSMAWLQDYLHYVIADLSN